MQYLTSSALFFPDLLPVVSAREILKSCVTTVKGIDSGFGQVIRVKIPALPYTRYMTLDKFTNPVSSSVKWVNNSTQEE